MIVLTLYFLFNLLQFVTCRTHIIDGKFTDSVTGFQFAIPQKLTREGEFVTFELPHYYEHSEKFEPKRKRSLDDPEAIHYGFKLADKFYHADLWPNRAMLAPNLAFESRDPKLEVSKRVIRSVKGQKLCYYTGRVRGIPESSIAFSTCDGLIGHISMSGKSYLIEPVKDHEPNSQGHHLHIVYEPRDKRGEKFCGTPDDSPVKMANLKPHKDKKASNIKRAAGNTRKYIELALVADKMFLTYHKGKRDYELYLMTVGNMAFNFFHHHSLDQDIDLVMVRIIYLEKEESEVGLKISQNVDESLDTFNLWSKSINLPEKDPHHHDIAALVTRHDFCQAHDPTSCTVAGLAVVAGACVENETALVMEDAGLFFAGLYLTHEIGHLLSCSHDGGTGNGKDCSGISPDNVTSYVMAIQASPLVLNWSPCCRKNAGYFLESGMGDCLNDEPSDNPYPFKDVPPGTVYDLDEQCRTNPPAKLKNCNPHSPQACHILFCRPEERTCYSTSYAPADGSECGKNKWCYKYECVTKGQRPDSVNGGWGEWSGWSDCSRTCGGGISINARKCDNPKPENGGRYCQGEKKKGKLCNVDPCPEGQPSYREMQCKAQAKEGQNYTAYYHPVTKCTLYCLDVATNSAGEMPEQIKDATECDKFSGNEERCIWGKCRKIGCDLEVESTAVEDICGDCNGDGTSCKLVQDTYKEQIGASELRKVIEIPESSTNIEFEELDNSANTVVVTDKSEKKYFLNENHRDNKMDSAGMRSFGKARGAYRVTNDFQEKITIHGPLTEPLVFSIYFSDPSKAANYRYKYAEKSKDKSYKPTYRWEQEGWSECSKACDTGIQTATYNCIEAKAGKVAETFCAGLDKPEASTKNCNDQPCKTRWKVGDWGECQTCKKKGGMQMRGVECMQENPKAGAEDILVEDAKCDEARPGTIRLCETQKVCKKGRSIKNVPDRYLEDIWDQMHRVGMYGGDMKSNM